MDRSVQTGNELVIAFACDLFMKEIQEAIEALMRGEKVQTESYLSEFTGKDLQVVEQKVLLLVRRLLTKVKQGLIVNGLVGVTQTIIDEPQQPPKTHKKLWHFDTRNKDPLPLYPDESLPFESHQQATKTQTAVIRIREK